MPCKRDSCLLLTPPAPGDLLVTVLHTCTSPVILPNHSRAGKVSDQPSSVNSACLFSFLSVWPVWKQAWWEREGNLGVHLGRLLVGGVGEGSHLTISPSTHAQSCHLAVCVAGGLLSTLTRSLKQSKKIEILFSSHCKKLISGREESNV